MGVFTTIYANHNLDLPSKSKEIVELLNEIWNGKFYIFDKTEVGEGNQTSNPNSYNIYVNPKLIEFELEKCNQITFSTDFKFTMNLQLHKKVLCIKPSGIGRFATNMIAEFMNKPFGIYENNPENFIDRKRDWETFKLFLNNITREIGGNKHIYLNDSKLSVVCELSLEGKTITDMESKAQTIVKPCADERTFVEFHTSVREDGIRNIKDDIWFVKGIND